MSHIQPLTPDELAKMSKLFELLDDAGRKRLLDAAELRAVPAGTLLCTEGEKGDEFFVVLAGKVNVTVDDFGTSKQVATLGRGGFFGEMAVLAAQPRSATVTASEPVDVLVFGRTIVEDILRDYPLVKQVLGKIGVMRTEELFEKMAKD